MFRATNVHYDVADRTRAMGYGGIGVIHQMCQRTGLVEQIDRNLHLLKFHLPYSESDHVLNIAFNALCGGTHLEDLELLRNDEVYMDALGTQRIPDPTTAGDFCRRFARSDVENLMVAINRSRLEVWKQQPSEFFKEAVIEADGTIVETTGASRWLRIYQPEHRPAPVHAGVFFCFDFTSPACRCRASVQPIASCETVISATSAIDCKAATKSRLR